MSGDCLPSATLSINERSDQLRGQGLKIYKMGLGQSPFPVPEILVDELKRNAFQKDYLPVKGLLELRRVVAEHHKRIFGIDCTDDDVLIGPGSKELMFILQLVYYGDIVIPTPAWVSYAPQAQIISRQIRLLHTHAENGWRLTPEQLDELCKSGGITTSHEFCESLLEETGIAILSGRDFGRVPEELTARLAYVNFEGKKALEAAIQIPSALPLNDKFLYSYCAGPVVATEKLCDWLKSF